MIDLKIHVNYTVTIHQLDDITYLTTQARELGLDYENTGTVELIRKLLIDSGMEGLGNLHEKKGSFTLQRN
jgi:hypothetical protein